MISLLLETEVLAQRLASARRLPPETIIHAALEQEARKDGITLEPRRPRDQSPAAIAARKTRTDDFIATLAALPMLDERSPHEIAADLDSL